MKPKGENMVTYFKKGLLASMAVLMLVLAGVAQAAPPRTTPRVAVKAQSFFCNMTYQAQTTGSGTGYRVLDGGQLGGIVFQSGDVILAVGNNNANLNIPLDALIQNAMQTGNQFVTVRDVNTGNVITLPF
jgi:hypothetical protein